MPLALYRAALGTGFLFAMTTLGAATVFFFAREPEPRFQKALLGFAAGIMTAASVWSLLLPAIEQAEGLDLPGWLPACAGMLAGCVFLAALDALLPYLRRKRRRAVLSDAVLSDAVPLDAVLSDAVPSDAVPSDAVPSDAVLSDAELSDDAPYESPSALLMAAITLHNIPEGMAVGLACAMASGGLSGAAAGTVAAETVAAGTAAGTSAAGAAALALGIGVQNFPEGAAVSLPLRGAGRGRAFLYGTLSGAVEPVFGLLAAGAAGTAALMPWLLSFAAGAMLYVVADELIPQARSRAGTCGYLAGFLLMMALDTALG